MSATTTIAMAIGSRTTHLSALMDQPNAEPYRTDGHPDGSDDQQYAEDEYSDEAPSGRRRGGLVMVAAVLGLAVLGTAGAFAYRAMLGGSIMPSLPPIIKAGGGPNKIVPANNPATQPGPSTQAAAGSGSGEKLVSREEQPVDIQDPVKSAPRIVSTIPVVPSVPAPGPVAPLPVRRIPRFRPRRRRLAPPATSPLTTGTPMPTSVRPRGKYIRSSSGPIRWETRPMQPQRPPLLRRRVHLRRRPDRFHRQEVSLSPLYRPRKARHPSRCAPTPRARNRRRRNRHRRAAVMRSR